MENNTGNALERMEAAIKKATIMRLLRSTHLISELRQRKQLMAIAPSDSDRKTLGERIRTEVCPANEDSTAWEDITLKTGLFDELVSHDKADLLAGPIATYSRSLDLVTDFLENDRNIPTTYHEQNLNRALNRFTLLEKMEEYLLEKYRLDIYAAHD